jgi:hypothetical protein
VTAIQKVSAEMRSDEAGDSGDQNVHGSCACKKSSAL